ncbi:pentapeptide repeat-containing protein [Streptomyces sp. 900105755]
MRPADLRSADLRPADLRPADLRSADLRSAHRCDVNSTTCWKVGRFCQLML